MSSIMFWSRNLLRIELDARSREARLRLEQLERLLVWHAVRRRLRLRAVLRYLRALCRRREEGPLGGGRPSGFLVLRFG
jgi:hypothetical protein